MGDLLTWNYGGVTSIQVNHYQPFTHAILDLMDLMAKLSNSHLQKRKKIEIHRFNKLKSTKRKIPS